VEPEGEAIADRLMALLADAAERRRLREAGLARAARFSWERTARELDALLSGAAGRPSS
jgi:glycosyltransferase involved in cell wall biosynthesis